MSASKKRKKIRKNTYKKQRRKIRLSLPGFKAAAVIFRFLRIPALMAAMGLVLLFCHDAVTQSRLLPLNAVMVTGQNRLEKNEILRQAGVRPNMNIFGANLSRIRKRLLHHPWIADVRVTRYFPDRIEIKIREEKPLALIKMGEKFLINTAGEIFKKWSPQDPDNLPVITGLAYADTKMRNRSGDAMFSSVMEILKMGKAPDSVLPNDQIQIIQVDRELGITLYTRGPVAVVKLGYGNYAKKYQRLQFLLIHRGHIDDGRLRNLQTVELKNPGRVVVTPGIGPKQKPEKRDKEA